jgi:hypothetical protein
MVKMSPPADSPCLGSPKSSPRNACSGGRQLRNPRHHQAAHIGCSLKLKQACFTCTELKFVLNATLPIMSRVARSSKLSTSKAAQGQEQPAVDRCRCSAGQCRCQRWAGARRPPASGPMRCSCSSSSSHTACTWRKLPLHSKALGPALAAAAGRSSGQWQQSRAGGGALPEAA